MIFFGHLGLTGLAAKAVEKSLGNIKIDYRVVFVGSILPDLIDKPIGRFCLPKPSIPVEYLHTRYCLSFSYWGLDTIVGIDIKKVVGWC